MHKLKINISAVILFTLCFILANQAIYSHVHLVKNQLIVHAHPHNESSSDHQHTAFELMFFNHLMQILSFALFGSLLLTQLINSSRIFLINSITYLQSFAAKNWFNKAPPCPHMLDY